MAKQARRRGSAGRTQAERHPRGVDLCDVGGQRGPPAGGAPPRGGGSAPRGRAGVHEERRPALLERGEQGRAASRALGAAQGAGEAGRGRRSPGPGDRRARPVGPVQARARPRRPPLAERRDARVGGGEQPLGLPRRAASRCRAGLDSATIARSRPSRSTRSARRTGSWSAGSTGHSGSPAMRSTHPSRERRMSGGRVRRASAASNGSGHRCWCTLTRAVIASSAGTAAAVPAPRPPARRGRRRRSTMSRCPRSRAAGRPAPERGRRCLCGAPGARG